MKRNYYHPVQDWITKLTMSMIKDNENLYEKLIPYKGSKVLVVQARNRQGYDNVIVPGVVVNYKGKTYGDDGKGQLSEVEPIKKKERPELEKIIRDSGFKGPISFWSDDNNEVK